jgi:hypothetical protein
MSLLLGPCDGASGNCTLDRGRFIIVVPVVDVHVVVVEHGIVATAYVSTTVVITIAIAIGVRHGGLGVDESLSGFSGNL